MICQTLKLINYDNLPADILLSSDFRNTLLNEIQTNPQRLNVLDFHGTVRYEIEYDPAISYTVVRHTVTATADPVPQSLKRWSDLGKQRFIMILSTPRQKQIIIGAKDNPAKCVFELADEQISITGDWEEVLY